MSEFSILLKYEMNAMFPIKKKKGTVDVVGTLISLLITLAIAGVVVYLLSTIVGTYIDIKFDKVSDRETRAFELLNALYLGVTVVLAGMSLEKMRSSLTNSADREIFLRLPVKQESIFLAKLITLMISNHISAFFMIIPINIIFFIALGRGFLFWVLTLAVWVFMPFVSFLIAALLIVPYIKIVDFVKERYVLLFVIFSAALVGAFLVYAEFLDVVRSLFELGSIKFLFNADLVKFLGNMSKWTYPAVSYAKLALGSDIILSLIIGLASALLSFGVTYFVTKKLYYITLYKNRDRARDNKVPLKHLKTPPFMALIKKEFINVFRDPNHMFSYFAISAAMPVMVYSCYTLFETLIENSLGASYIGDKVSFSLSLVTILLFNILTNTFCSTNVTRDGESTLKIKAMPLKASKIMFSKVIFCSFVSSASVLASILLLCVFADLSAVHGALCFVIILIFAISQILVATRLDLNGASLTANHTEMEKKSSKTIALTVSIGLVLCLIVGMSSLLVSLMAGPSETIVFFGAKIPAMLAYIIPAVIAVLYCGFAVFFYTFRIEKRFEALVR